MSILIKIAFRNIIKGWKKSLPIFSAICISCMIFLISNALFNGAEEQIISGYISNHAGHVMLLWEEAHEVSSDSPERLFRSQFDPDHDEDYFRIQEKTRAYLENQKEYVQAFYPRLERFGDMIIGTTIIRSAITGLTPEYKSFLEEQHDLILIQGDLDFSMTGGILINEDVAKQNNLSVGDWVDVEGATVYGVRNPLMFEIKGIYKNRAPWDNWAVYITHQDAEEFFNAPEGTWDMAQIMLKDQSQSRQFAEMLNTHLGADTRFLLAAAYEDACSFLMNLAGYFRAFYIIFVIFLIFIIGMGIRSTVRMNIFERMREFGTLRAIGYSKFRNFLLIFLELFFLSLFALFIATILSLLFVLILSIQGIFIGTGPMSYMFGGDHIYPFVRAFDVFYALMIMLVLSLFAPLKPALVLNSQKIADILHRRQKKVSAILEAAKSFFQRNAS